MLNYTFCKHRGDEMHKISADVLVIGGGVVGSSILRELSLYDLKAMLVEKQPDVCEGTSKANSGIVHTGFDAKPGTVEAECLRRSRSLWPQLVEKLRIPLIPCGAVMVATNDEEWHAIQTKYIPSAAANGVEVNLVDRETLRAMNPDVTESAFGGLAIPGESICDPFWAARAHAELAVLNGAQVLLGNGVTAIDPIADGFLVRLEDGTVIEAGFLVNAAGLWSDEISRMLGDDSFEITPRKGEFLLTEEHIGITQIILPVPTAKSKGILVSPVIFGGFLLGPTAEDQTDKADRSTSEQGMNTIRDGTEKLIPGISGKTSIRQFAGVRAVCSTGDFVIRPSETAPRMVHAAGIRSTGLSASPGIAQMVVEQLVSVGLILTPKVERIDSLDDIFNSDESNPGEIVCMCRSITKQEIAGALSRPLAPRTIDGIKRRTGATLGECQGNYCLSPIMDLIRDKTGNANQPMLKGMIGSELAGPMRQGGHR